MPEFKKVADTAEIPAGTGKIIDVDGNQIAIWNLSGNYYAFQNVCPHRGGPVGEGELEGNVITCPWHGWQFDVRTGQHQLSPSIRQQSLPVRVEGDDILVALE